MKPAIELIKSLSDSAKRIQSNINGISKPPSDVSAPTDQPVLPHALFRNTRGYLEKIIFQINRCYEHTAYDACAVMIRRLVEVLIIESFEHKDLTPLIKNLDGDYFYLSDLIDKALEQTQWNLGRNTKRGLTRLKKIGDYSAHSRRYNARREDIDKVIMDLRVISEELLYVAGLRK